MEVDQRLNHLGRSRGSRFQEGRFAISRPPIRLAGVKPRTRSCFFIITSFKTSLNVRTYSIPVTATHVLKLLHVMATTKVLETFSSLRQTHFSLNDQNIMLTMLMPDILI